VRGIRFARLAAYGVLSALLMNVAILPEQGRAAGSAAFGSATSPVSLLGNQIAVAARADFLKQLGKSSHRSSNLDFHIDPLFNKVLAHQVIVDTQVSSDFWAEIRPVDQQVEIYVAPTNDMEYLMNYMWPTLDANGQYGNWLPEKVARGKVDSGFYGGGAPAYDKNGHPVFMMFAPNDMSQGNSFWDKSTSHEFTHLIQRYIMNGDFAPLEGWVVEGQADYIGVNIGTRNSTAAFASTWAELIQFLKKESSKPQMLNWTAAQFVQWFKDQEITHAQSAIIKSDIPLESYVLGALAFQYLYGTYGFQKVTDYYENLAKLALSACVSSDVIQYPQCIPARHRAFEATFGISMDDFYVKVAPFIVSEIKWSAQTIRKLPADISKIALVPWSKTPLQPPYVKPAGLGPIPEYGNLALQVSDGTSDSQTIPVSPQSGAPQNVDHYPPNIPAPNRSCPGNDSAHATLYGGSMTCIKGLWTLDPGQVIGAPPKP